MTRILGTGLLRRACFVLAALAIVPALRETPASAQTQLSVCAPMPDEGTQMCLEGIDERPLGSRTPLLLIHGWTFDRPGPPRPAVWDNFINYSAQVPWFAGAFKVYRVTYYSNVTGVTDIGRILAELVDRMDTLDSSFANQKLVIVGHSMGGLVARSFMQEWRLQKGLGISGGDRVLHLTTLGTPHHGTPMANGPARDDRAGSFLRLLNLFDSLVFRNMPWSEANRSDLHADRELSALAGFDYARFAGDENPWLDRLNTDNPYRQRISTFTGAIRTGQGWVSGCQAVNNPLSLSPATVMDCTALVINDLYGNLANDGIVPVVSGAVKGCDTCVAETLPGYDHFQIAQGQTPNDSRLFDLILNDLAASAGGNADR